MRFKRRKKNVNHDYVNCNFILGSSAVVDSLWSMANRLLDRNQSRKSPLLMESLLFLHQNRRYWYIGVLHKAYKGTCFSSVKNNMAEDEKFNEMNN